MILVVLLPVISCWRIDFSQIDEYIYKGYVNALVSNNSAEFIQDFVEFGLSDGFTTRMIEGVTPLHISSYLGNYQISKLLLEQGALIVPEKMCRSTQLHLAVHSSNLDLVQLLLHYQASINAVGDSNCLLPLFNNYVKIETTALHMAIVRKDMDMVQLLVQNGADIYPNDLEKSGDSIRPFLRTSLILKQMETKVKKEHIEELLGYFTFGKKHHSHILTGNKYDKQYQKAIRIAFHPDSYNDWRKTFGDLIIKSLI